MNEQEFERWSVEGLELRRQRYRDRNIRCLLPLHVARWLTSAFADIDVAKAALRERDRELC